MPCLRFSCLSLDLVSWRRACPNSRSELQALLCLLQVDSLHAKVLGKLPAWLRGSFYRNGPGEGGLGCSR